MISLTPHDLEAISLSIKVATAASICSLPFALAVAYLLAFKRFRGKALVEGVINLPLVLPPVVTGYLLLLLLGRHGWVGKMLLHFDITIIFTITGAIIASSVVGFPLLVRAIRLGMESIDKQLIQVSHTLGASPWDTLFSIILPLSFRAMVAGITLMFARSLGEFGATIILAGNIPGVTQTIPLAIYQYTNTPGEDRMALTLCIVSVALSLTVLLMSEWTNDRLKRSLS